MRFIDVVCWRSIENDGLVEMYWSAVAPAVAGRAGLIFLGGMEI